MCFVYTSALNVGITCCPRANSVQRSVKVQSDFHLQHVGQEELILNDIYVPLKKAYKLLFVLVVQ